MQSSYWFKNKNRGNKNEKQEFTVKKQKKTHEQGTKMRKR